MAHISIARRTDGCLYLLRHGGDTDATIQYILREMADEPAIQQAKNKEKLARNIISMGGSGLNQDANITAMRRAMDIYADEKHRAEVAKLEQRVASLESDLERERSAKYDVELDYRKVSEQLNKAQVDYRSVSEELNRMLMEGRPADAAGVGVFA